MSQGTGVASRTDQTAFRGKIDKIRREVDARLDMLVPITGEPSRAARHSLLAPGKRLRAVMTVLAAEQCGGSPEDALDTACAVEMIHTASLVFDDLPAMDDALLRRGMPTPHTVFGDDVAILAGIGLLNGAFGAVAQCASLNANQKTQIISVLSEAVGWHGLVLGQALDLQSDQADTTLEDIHYGKTGALFVAASLAGAVTADANSSLNSLFVQYGRALGHAYQAFDDVLDHVADEEVAGKSTGRDIGKHTAAFSGAGGSLCVDTALSRARGHLEVAKSAFADGDEDISQSASAPLADLADHIGIYFDKTFEADR
ncbi:MAG: polyprenyl synthetase family protein [Pseudomonadota bacterium]